MRLAELSSLSGLSTATIKYYVRSGLLPQGHLQSSTWATYDDRHLRRLRLVRALTEVAGLSLEQVRQVVEAIDAAESQHAALGAVQWSLSPEPPAEPSTAALAQVDALLGRHGWELAPGSPHRHRLAAALDRLAELELPAADDVLDSYVRALEPVAEVEVSRVGAGTDANVAAERLVVGTLLYEPVLLTLRRMAHEVISGRR